MKGAYFFIVFFLLFTSAVFLISTPMFPGNMLLSIANLHLTLEHAALLSALINGVTYGLIAWAIFAVAMRRMEGTASRSPVKKQKRRK
jgi:Na+/proline symporter